MNQDFKQAYKEKMELQLKEWKLKVEELKVKASKLGIQHKLNINKSIEQIKGKLQETHKQLWKFEQGAEGEVEAVKEKLNNLAQEIKEAIKDTFSRAG